MEQDFVEKIFQNYDHLKGKYLGCFCKDQMDELSHKIKINMVHDVNPRAFALINTGHLSSSGENWMGLVMNKVTKFCGYFDSFGRHFKWLHEPLKKRSLIKYTGQAMLCKQKVRKCVDYIQSIS